MITERWQVGSRKFVRVWNDRDEANFQAFAEQVRRNIEREFIQSLNRAFIGQGASSTASQSFMERSNCSKKPGFITLMFA